MKEHVVSDHLGERAKRVRKINQGAFLCVAGTCLLVICRPACLPLAFLVGVPVLIWCCVANGNYVTWRAGREGEMLFRYRLADLGLPDSWTAWHGVPAGRNREGEIMDTDCILLGPGGLFVFEVKHYNGYTVCMDGRWRRRKVGRRGTVYRGRIGSPSGQLTRNVVSLKEWIERTGKAPWIQAYVIFTNGWLHSEGMRHLKAIEISRLAEVVPQGRNMLDDDALAALTNTIRIYCVRPV